MFRRLDQHYGCKKTLPYYGIVEFWILKVGETVSSKCDLIFQGFLKVQCGFKMTKHKPAWT